MLRENAVSFDNKQRIRFKKYKQKKKKLLNRKPVIQWMWIHQLFRPLMRMILLIQRTSMRFQVEILKDFYIDDKRPTIFAVTHIGKWDFEIVNEILKPQFYILAADFIHTYGTIAGIMLKMFGVIYVDECDKEDKRNSKYMLEAVLNQGGNVMIFPEGTWNLSDN